MSAYLSLTGRRRGGRLSEAERLLTFSAFRMGANSRLGAYSNKYGTQACMYFSWLFFRRTLALCSCE